MTDRRGVRQPFHGWNILFLATFSQFVSVGFSLYLIGIYIEPLSTTFGATPGQLGWASSIFLFVASGLGPVLGYWVDRGRVRLLLTLGAAALALGLLLLAHCQSLWQAALVCATLIAPGSSMLGIVTAGAMLVQWFERRRGMALGICAAGLSLGGFCMPPLAAWLFATTDWRAGSLALGAFVALLLVPAAWLIAVSRPEEVGQYPDGADRPPARGTVMPTQTESFTRLLRRQDFWLITLTIATVNFTSIMIITYLVPYARERGLDSQSSALMLSVYAGAAFCGKFIAGWLADRVQPRRILTGIAGMMALGLLAMVSLAYPLSFPLTAGGVGLALGGLMPVWAALVALNFGPQAFGKVKGAMSLVLTSAAIIPGPLGGFLYDTSGTYTAAFTLPIGVLAAGVLISLFIPANARGGSQSGV